MSYTVGFSSGFFKIVGADEKAQLMTIPRKILRGEREGVNFTQVDIETITEFKEPFLKEEIERLTKMGIRFGVHGEAYAMGVGEKPIGMLDSALETDYFHSHERLIQHIEGCGMIKAEYVNIHPSETTPFLKLSMHLQPTKLVDPWGRPIEKFLKENPYLLDWVLEKGKEFMWEFARITDIEDFIKNQKREAKRYYIREHGKKDISSLSASEVKQIEDDVIKNIKNYFVGKFSSSDLSYGAERVAYYLVAKWMKDNNDTLWKNIVGNKVKKDKDFETEYRHWVPAVSSKYIEGHFRPKDTKKYRDPIKMLKENKLIFAFESQMGTSGLEGYQRLVKPIHMINLCEAIGSRWVKVCIDFEHVLSQNLDPDEEIEAIPDGKGNLVEILHLGFPTPHTPAHMPLDIGSREQEYLYKIIYKLKKKGFKRGYLIFERGSAPAGTSLLAIRKIKEFLEKNVAPEKLDLKFYGMEEKDFAIKKQEVAIRTHALDPLRGMLSVPEEEHTFLSSEAVRKGKGEEWGRRRYR